MIGNLEITIVFFIIFERFFIVLEIAQLLKKCGMVLDSWTSSSSLNLNMHDWIQTNSTSPSMCTFLAGFWWNWRAHNIVCVGKESIFFFQVLAETRKLASIMEVCFRNSNISPIDIDGCPGIHCFALMVDGSYLGDVELELVVYLEEGMVVG